MEPIFLAMIALLALTGCQVLSPTAADCAADGPNCDQCPTCKLDILNADGYYWKPSVGLNTFTLHSALQYSQQNTTFLLQIPTRPPRILDTPIH